MLNALGHVHIGNRKALKFLNSKIEYLDGALQKTGENDVVRVLNGLLTQSACDNSVAADGLMGDNKGEYEFTAELKRRLDENLWYILN